MPLAEVFSQLHGNCESVTETSWCTPKDWGTSPSAECYVVGGLKQGVVAGLIAGGDNHSARPGSYMFGASTAVLTDDFTTTGIVEAMRLRHTYATSGQRPVVEFACGSAIMGDVVEYGSLAGAPTFHYSVATPGEITKLRIVRVTSGTAAYVLDQTPASGTVQLSGDLTDAQFSQTWPFATYYLVVEYKHDRAHFFYTDPTDRAWTSPIFLRPGPAEAQQWQLYR